MKRHFRNIGVFNSEQLHSESEAVFQLRCDGENFFIHFQRRWQLEYFAKQIKELFEKDLKRAQSRRDMFK